MSIATPIRDTIDQTTWPFFPIVMLHRVTSETPQPNPYDLCRSQGELAQIIYTLRARGHRIVSLREAVEAHDAGRDVRKLACLTFDDGYRDFLTHAWPVLKRNDAPATVFLVAERLGDFNTWDYGTVGLEQAPLLDRDEVLQLAREGCEFGSHSSTHPMISELAVADRGPEIAGSKRALEALLEREVSLFAYPHIDQDEDAQRQVAAAGYVAAVGGEQMANSRFVLHRVELSRMDPTSMRLRLGGWRYRAQRLPAMSAARLVKNVLRPKIK
jgi:peptidoglycan/xylan/chitin deacetylase (PgdA/CDA1 family)